MGEAQSGGEVTASLQALQLFSRGWLEWASSFDVLLTPTVGVPPLPIGAYAMSPARRAALRLLTALPGGVLRRRRDEVLAAFEPVFKAAPYTMIANVTGQPSLSLPLHWTPDRLPMGMLFTASRIGDEASLFRLAAQLEQAVPWSHRIAPHAVP